MRLCFLLVLFGMSTISWGQKKQAAIWRYGRFNGIDFNKQPVDIYRTKSDYQTGSASVCDSNGRLQFSFDGLIFFDHKDSILVNLSPLEFSGIPYGGYDASLIIPFQANPYQFHVFSLRDGPLPPTLYRMVFDMRLNSGLGGWDTAKTEIIDRKLAYHITCLLHQNNKDTWLVSRRRYSDTLIAWQIQDTGVVKIVKSKIGSPLSGPNVDPIIGSNSWDAPLKSSPNSEFMIIPRRAKQYPFHELLKFDRATGRFHSKVLIRDTTKTGNNLFINGFSDGCFSPDSRLLYIATGTRANASLEFEGPGNFWQFSLDNYDSLSINQSRLFIGRLGRGNPNRSEPYPFSPRMQLAMDGKIYVSPGLSSDSLLSIIHCPNNRGYDCKLKFREINLQKGRNGSSFPTLNQTFVRNAGIFQLQANKRSICQNDTLELSGYGAGAEQFQWSVSPAFPASVKLDTLTWQKIPTRQLAPGIYTFSCRAFSRCGDVFEKTISVEIKPLPARPNVTTIQKTVPCKGDSVIVKIQNPVLGNQYFWSTGDTASFTIVRQTGLYSLDSVSNAVGCGLKVGDTLAVVIKDILVPDEPVLASPQLVEVCAGVQSSTLKVQSTGRSVVWNTGQTGDSVSVSGAGKYWAIHQTEEGCTSAASDTINLVVVPLPLVQLVTNDNGHCLGNEETKRYKVISFNSKVKTVELEGGEVVGETDSTITIHWFEGTQTQSQNRLTIKSQNRLGCSGADLVFSPIPNPEACRDLYPLFIPNLVTANNDKHNDRWEMGNILYHQPVSVRIYNRWGQTVFETDSYQNNWPSTSLSSGTYFYRVSSFGKEWKGWMEVNDK